MQMLAETLSILWNNRIGFAAGLWVTLKLVGCIWSVGLVAGIFLGTLGEKLPRSFGLLLQLFSAFFAAIPAIVLLFWAYFPLQMLLGVDIDPFWTAAGTLSLLNTVSAAEIIRRQLIDFPPQYRDAARVCGLTERKIFFAIEFPLILRQAVPALLFLQVSMLHCTLFASLISVEDVFRVAQRLNSSLYRPVEIYSALALIFLALSLPLQLLAQRVQRRIGLTMKER